MDIPDGYSEEEVIAIINTVADRLCYKFKFGYHSADDMKQQARLFAWEGMEKFDGKRPLENFLWTHVRNRLYNFKRNNYARLEKPCDTCEFYISKQCTAFDDQMECSLYKGWSDRNNAKKSLMHSISVDFDQKEQCNNMLSTIQSNEIIQLVDSELHVSLREDWIRFVNNLKLSKVKKDRLIEEINKVLEENNIDTQAW